MLCYEDIEDGAELKKCLEEGHSLFAATAIETPTKRLSEYCRAYNVEGVSFV